MLGIIWLLLIAVAITTPLVWLLDHNGSVVINWLNYEISTDIVTAILIFVVFTIAVFLISYLLTRILAIRFPSLLRSFFTRRYIKSLEKIIERHHQGFVMLSEMLLALESKDKKAANSIHLRLKKLIKNKPINDFLIANLSILNENFNDAAQIFDKFGGNKNAKSLALKARMKSSLSEKDEASAIAYSKQLLLINESDEEAIKILFDLYKKHGLWSDAKALANKYSNLCLKDELKKRDITIINTALALEAYQNKKFLNALKYAKIALKGEKDFLPALEILLKSWLKLGLAFKTNWKIRKIWRSNPHLVLAEIYNLSNRRNNPAQRVIAMKRLAKLNPNSSLSKLAVGLAAFRAGLYSEAEDALRESLNQEKSYRAYKILAFTSKALGKKEEFALNNAKAEMLSKDDHYSCSSCGHTSSRWSSRCSSCNEYDSLEWGS